MNIIDIPSSTRRNPKTKDFVETVNHHYSVMNRLRSEDTLSPKAFFITVTFNDLPEETREYRETKNLLKKKFYEPEDVIKITSRRQRDFIKYVKNQTVPSNYYPSRKKNLPVFFSFIDLSGSRFSKSNFLKMPHTHSLCLVPPKTVPKFDALIADDFRISRDRPKTKDIQTTDCKPVEFDGNNIYNVLDYSSKYYRYCCNNNMFSEDTRSLLFDM